jgi:poly-gamma-glutamate synthesis protein (capsule biosynthesis protein)
MTTAPIQIVAVGDIMLGDSSICVGWGFNSRWTGARAFEAMRAAISVLQGDLVIGNLESPLAVRGQGSTRWQRDQMRALPAVAQSLRDLGFDMISVANNHAVQHGLDGFEQTVQALEGAGLLVLGLRGTAPWCSKPVVVDCRGVRIGVLAYCWRPRQYDDAAPPFAEGSLDSAIADVRRLCLECPMVVVSLHWGDEFLGQPSVEQVEHAARLVGAGALVVVGHHPHVIRPVQRIGRGLVAYSLGNFASDMTWLPESRSGAVLHCRVDTDGVDSFSTTMVYTEDDYRLSIDDDAEMPDLSQLGLDARSYEAGVRSALGRQRGLAYRHALLNAHRYKVSVLGELIMRTLRNKVAAACRRAGRRR